MHTPVCDRLAIEFPIFAFSHCRDVVAAVTNAGGFGVLGATGHTPRTLDIDLTWIDEQVKGKPYGVDLLLPAKYEETSRAGAPRFPARQADRWRIGPVITGPSAHRAGWDPAAVRRRGTCGDCPGRHSRPGRIVLRPRGGAAGVARGCRLGGR